MSFVNFDFVKEFFAGRTVAIIGSGPGCLKNEQGFVDSHEIVVRVNNYKTGFAQGFRTDVHHSFYGTSIRKTSQQLISDGVKLCMCKCPNSRPIESAWHVRNRREVGIDFRYIYRNRNGWWPCDVFVPDDAHFLKSFDLLGRHIPTSGFAAILDVLKCSPKSVYITGFDFFQSGRHNVDEPWTPGDPYDPIKHVPNVEAQWLAQHKNKFTADAVLDEILGRLS